MRDHVDDGKLLISTDFSISIGPIKLSGAIDAILRDQRGSA